MSVCEVFFFSLSLYGIKKHDGTGTAGSADGRADRAEGEVGIARAQGHPPHPHPTSHRLHAHTQTGA
eukprot:332990-Prymnesium_polylepis.1